VTRILLYGPFDLLVASRPFDDYPQELCLRFRTRYASKTKVLRKGPSEIPFTNTYLPDSEITQDFASVITLLCRRLICVAAKTREQFSELSAAGAPDVLRDLPMPFVFSVSPPHWPSRPATLVFGPRGIDVKFHQPRPVGIDPEALKTLLLALPSSEYAQEFVQSCRLYAAAMEHIGTRPEMAYQFLISAVETLANMVLSDWEPERAEVVESKTAVYSRALELGLPTETAEDLAVAAGRDERWAGRKFKKLILDHVGDAIGAADTLFDVPEFFLPPRDSFTKTLGVIYRARSKALHEGHRMPSTVGIGTSQLLTSDSLIHLYDFSIPPPVAWFERVVNVTLSTFIKRFAALENEPAEEERHSADNRLPPSEGRELI
jgi:hypothetical protein